MSTSKTKSSRLAETKRFAGCCAEMSAFDEATSLGAWEGVLRPFLSISSVPDVQSSTSVEILR
jgi:hypothetical protein